VADEYLAWGKSQGGRNGRPWGHDHLALRDRHLKWWPKTLGLETFADLDAALPPRVEEALRALQNKGKKGKTPATYADSLRSFCNWCVERGYLAENLLRGSAPFNMSPQTTRRAISLEELIASAAPRVPCFDRKLTSEYKPEANGVIERFFHVRPDFTYLYIWNPAIPA